MINAVSRRISIGIVIAARSVTGTVQRGGAVSSVTVPLPGDNGSVDADAVRRAFIDLRQQLEAVAGVSTQKARAHIALLPPNAEARLITLPPLRPREAAAVVSRDAGRYFMAATAPLTVSVGARHRLASVKPGSGEQRPDATAPSSTAQASTFAPTLAAAAVTSIVEAAWEAATHAGWTVAGVTPAHTAWLAAAVHTHGAALRAVIAVADGTACIMQVQDGTPMTLRRLPGTETDAIVAAAGDSLAAGGSAGRLALYCDAEAREGIARVAAHAGWTVAPAETTASETAARFAHAAGLHLVPASADTVRRAQQHRVALRLAVATVLLLAGAAMVELWGAHRELDTLRGRRAEIRAEVGPLLAVRDSIDRLSGDAEAVEIVAASSPRWTEALFDLAMLLPQETHLTRLHTTGDTIIVEAEGARAGATLQALRTAASLRDARLLGTVDRELADGTTTVERFRLSARLAGAQSNTAPSTGTPSATAPRRAAGGRP